MGIYTTFPHNKNNELQQHHAPSLVGEGWGEESKIKHLHSPRQLLHALLYLLHPCSRHPNLLPLEKEQ